MVSANEYTEKLAESIRSMYKSVKGVGVRADNLPTDGELEKRPCL